jgi:hypothetical protein
VRKARLRVSSALKAMLSILFSIIILPFVLPKTPPACSAVVQAPFWKWPRLPPQTSSRALRGTSFFGVFHPKEKRGVLTRLGASNDT